jgi:uncharacterized protein (DUF1501 family)
LSAEALYEGRDLALTTDVREVLAEAVTRHLQVPAAAVPVVFPGYVPTLTPGQLLRPI